MFLKVYKSRVWILLFMLMPFIGNAQIPGLPAGWEFTLNPTSATYAIPTDVAFNGVDALTAGDWVGAFYMDNGVMECGGAVEWTGTENVAIVVFGNDTLVAPDKNGFSEGEAINWMVYRTADECVKAYDATSAEFNWTNGALEAIASFGPCEECQEIALSEGFQFISSYIAAPDPDIQAVMTDVLGNLEYAVNSNGDQLVQFFGFWQNGIGDWMNEEGYLAKMTGNDVLVVCGEKIDPQTPIDVETGFQFVSYLDDQPQDALVAFDGVLDNLEYAVNSNGDQLVQFFGFWQNGIGNLNPGEGYLLKMLGDDQLIYPPVDALSAPSTGQTQKQMRGVHWPEVLGDPSQQIWTMYVFTADFNGTTLEAGDELAIFDGDLLVGSLVLPGVPPGQPNPAYALKAWSALTNGPGYVAGNAFTVKCWDASEDLESTSFTHNFLPGAYTGDVFPPAGSNVFTAAEFFFTGDAPEAPVLNSAIAGDASVDLTWTEIGADLTDGVHWPEVLGDPSQQIWTMYVFTADLNGTTLEASDEIAIFDGDLLVGSMVLPGVPPGNPNPAFALKAWSALVDGPGYVAGNEFTVKCWDASEDLESTSFTYNFLPGAYTGDVFPPAGSNVFTAAEFSFSAQAAYVPTFNIYQDGVLAVEGVEGNMYTVDGLTNGQEYCFTVSQIMEDLTESGQSNELCATPEAICEDVVINMWPDAPADVCFGTPVDIDFSGVEILNAVSYEYSVDPVEAGSFDGDFFLLDDMYVGVLTITLNAFATPPCMDASASLSFEVFALPEVTLEAFAPVCAGSGAFDLTGGLPEGGTYYVDGVEATMFDPAMAGTYAVEYMYTDMNGCSASATGEIIVNELPDVMLMAFEPLCAGSDAFELFGGTPEGGTYFVDGEEATMFDPAVAGLYMVEYVYTDGNGCTASAEGEILVNELPDVMLMAFEPLCAGSDAFELFGGTPEGGTYFVDGEEATMFDPAVAGLYMVEYVYTDGNGCTASADGEILVNALPEVTCPGDMTVLLEDLPLTLEGATPANGTYSGDGVLDGVFFVDVEGTYDITYTYTDDNGCTNECMFTITVGEVGCLDAEITGFPEGQEDVCAGTELVIDFSGVEILNAVETEWLVDPEEAGEFLGTDFVLATDYVGMVTITLNAYAQEPCMMATASLSFTVNPLPDVMLMAYEPVCAGSEAFDLFGGTPEGGMYFVDGEEATMFDPAVAGTYMVEYVYTDENGCSASATGEILVNELPDVMLMAFEPLCAGSEAFDLFGGTPEGGMYFVDGEEATMFDPAVAGTYMVEYVYTDENGCTASATGEIVVNALPTLEYSYSALEICLGESVDVTVTGPEDGAYPYTVEYSVNGMVLTDVIEGSYLEYPFTPDMAGVYTIVVLSITDDNGCVSMPDDVFELTVLPLTEITAQPMSLEVEFSMPAEFSVEAVNATGYQWYHNDMMIDGATDATYMIASAMPEDAGTYYCVVMGDCGDVTSETATLTVLPWTQTIDLLGAVNGFSTYLDIDETDVATIFGGLTAIQVVDFVNPNFTWVPGGSDYSLTEDKGAKVLLGTGGYPTSVDVMGYPTLGTMVDLPMGTNYIPVWSQSVVLADDVFGPHTDDIFAVFSMDYSGYWYPAYGLYTLEYLVPGSSYMVLLYNDVTFDFDVPAVDAAPGYANIPRNITTWDDAVLTATQHNIVITSDAMTQLENGDVVGAFNEFGQITGMVEITSTRDHAMLRTYGDNPFTQETEGFVAGDVMTIKVWRNGEEMIAQATFDENLPNQNVFAKNGVSTITNLKLGATSINDFTSNLTASLYPNPATDLVNISTNFEISNVKVVNYVGQVVFDQDVDQMNFQINTSNYGSGMYFVQIENLDGVVITKRLTVK